MAQLIDIFLHLDVHLQAAVATYNTWTYALLFLVVFCETGLVVTPILPGDSLLFAAGAIAAGGSLDTTTLFLVLSLAAILGDTVNYRIGRWVGPRVFTRDDVRFLNKKYLERSQTFYERYGSKTIIIARFVPIIRTFAPFVAGIGKMHYARFITYNIVGGMLWVATCVAAGYFWGQLPFVKENFSLVILAICVVSVLPAVIEILRQRRATTETP